MNTADLVLINGKTLSVDLAGSVTRGEAAAVKDGIIIAAGTSEEMNPFIGSRTKVIDCKGHTVLPGLCDGHCHAASSAGTYAACDLFNIYQEEGESNEDVIKKYTDRSTGAG